MNKIQVRALLIGLACLLGMSGCTSGNTAMTPAEAPVESPSDSLKACLAGIPNDSSDGVKMVAEQSCQENEQLRQGLAGTAIAKSAGRASAGTQGDSLEACLARIPEDATAGQRMLAEETCARDQLTHR